MTQSVFLPAWRSGARAFLAAAAFLSLAENLPAVAAETSAASVRSVQVGWNGSLKAGAWTPIILRAEGVSASTEAVAITPDYDGNLVESALAREPAEGNSAAYTGLIQVGRLDGVIRVELRESSKAVDARSLAVTAAEPDRTVIDRHETEYWGTLGTKAPFAEAAASGAVRSSQLQMPAARAFPLQWSEFPNDPLALESLDVLVIGGDALQMTGEQSRLIAHWTASGGRLVISLGSATASYQASPVARWIPMNVTGSRLVSQLDPVAALVPRSAALTVSRLDAEVPAALIEGPAVGSLGGPVLLRRGYGMGTVTLFAFGLDDTPISRWDDLPGLCRILAHWGTPESHRLEDRAELASSGVNDLATQLISQLDQFGGVERPSFQRILMWTLLWLLLLGPLDYVVVHKLLRKPHATWITLPLWVALAVGVSVQSATAANVHPLDLNEIDLLDLDPQAGVMRGRSWLTLYSPETARYDVAAKSTLTGDQAQLSWLAKPDEGLRGLYRKGGSSSTRAPRYQINADRTRITGLPIRVWSSFGLSSDWESRVDSARPLITARLTDSGSGLLRGTLSHQFSEPLVDWILVYRRFVFFPASGPKGAEAELKAGTEWRPDLGKQLLINAFLKGAQESYVPGHKSSISGNVNLSIEKYDPLVSDPLKLMQMLIFHEAAGGSGYTGLTDDPLGTLDISRLVTPDQTMTESPAVLLGRTRAQVTSVEVDGAAVTPGARWTFVRAILPVELGERPIYKGDP